MPARRRLSGRASRRCSPAPAPWLTVFTSMFLHGGALPRRRQHALPVDLRQQRRGHARPRALRCSSTWSAAWRRPSPRPGRPGSDDPHDRGQRRGIGGARRLPPPLPARPGARRWSCFGFFVRLVYVPALVVLGFWIVVQLISGCLPSRSSGAGREAGAGVAWLAHVGRLRRRAWRCSSSSAPAGRYRLVSGVRARFAAGRRPSAILRRCVTTRRPARVAATGPTLAIARRRCHESRHHGRGASGPGCVRSPPTSRSRSCRVGNVPIMEHTVGLLKAPRLHRPPRPALFPARDHHGALRGRQPLGRAHDVRRPPPPISAPPER